MSVCFSPLADKENFDFSTEWYRNSTVTAVWRTSWFKLSVYVIRVAYCNIYPKKTHQKHTHTPTLHCTRFDSNSPFLKILSGLFMFHTMWKGIVCWMNKYILHSFAHLPSQNWVKRARDQVYEFADSFRKVPVLMWIFTLWKPNMEALRLRQKRTRTKAISIIYFENLKLPFICKTG